MSKAYDEAFRPYVPVNLVRGQEPKQEIESAPKLLNKAASIMEERGKQYDKPTGERSMDKTVAAFNAITGRNLSEAEGWEFMACLKQVRLFQNPATVHRDSFEDLIAYSALLGECAATKGISNAKVT